MLYWARMGRTARKAQRWSNGRHSSNQQRKIIPLLVKCAPHLRWRFFWAVSCYSMQLSELGEFKLIERVQRSLPAGRDGVVVGIGDDTAVLAQHGERYL